MSFLTDNKLVTYVDLQSISDLVCSQKSTSKKKVYKIQIKMIK